jgi:hypothetical protein
MTLRTTLRRTVFVIALSGIVPTLAACPKKAQPVQVDAEPPPPAVDAAPMVLEPIVDDAGADTGPDVHHASGNWKPQDPLVANLSKCCSALSAQAKANGNPPDLMPAVNMCNQTVAQLKANPNAPELNTLRPMLKMLKNAPGACSAL